MKQLNKFDEFRLARKLIGFNQFLQSLLLVTFIIGVNLFAMKFSIRWDITSDQSNSLTPESIAHLQEVKESISIFILVDDSYQLSGGRLAIEDLEPLLDQYRDTASRVGVKSFQVERIHVFRDREKILRLKDEYEFDQENVVLVGSLSGRRVVPVQEMYQKNGDTGGLEFQGEQILTAAILEVSNPVDKRIYFTVGHGEMDLNDVDPQRGLTELATYLNYRNVRSQAIDLSRYEYIPEEVESLVIASPQAAFSSEEVEKLRHYLEKNNGSLLVFLEPFRKHGLDELLYDWGILCEDAVIIDPGSDYQASSGNLILRMFAEHPITQPLYDNDLPVYSNRPRPVRLDSGVPRVAGVQRTPLIATSKTSWAEIDFRDEEIPEYSSSRDVAGPVPVGVLSERRGGESLGLKLKGGKLIVFGDASLISNELFGLYGNRMLITNSLNWCLQRNHLLSIPSQKIKNYRLTISEADLNSLMIALLLMPVTFAVLGLIIRVIRR